MTGDDFYVLATDLLLSENSTAARLRTSVSRAYYAAFHRASALLSSIGIVLPKGAECHSKLVYVLSNSSDADVAIVGTKLAALRRARNEADYDLSKATMENAAKVEFQMRVASEIIACIDECLAGGSKVAVHPSLRKYASEVLRLPVL
jgi:uncharacterized protein (UPF0332 family)